MTRQGEPTDVLVVHASRNGGTASIAAVLAEELRSRGLAVDVTRAEDMYRARGGLEAYGTVVLGSAIYLRRWRPAAVRFLRRHGPALRHRHIWLFQSGPCGPDATQQIERGMPVPGAVERLRDVLGAEPVVTFGGVLDPKTATGFVGRRLARSELAGDYRDIPRIRAWAATIAEAALRAAGHEPAALPSEAPASGRPPTVPAAHPPGAPAAPPGAAGQPDPVPATPGQAAPIPAAPTEAAESTQPAALPSGRPAAVPSDPR